MNTRSELTIGELAARSGVATSALRFYEAEGLIASRRTDGNQRRYDRAALRRVALVRAGGAAGIPLQEIRRALARLPHDRTPTKRDWERLSRSWSRDVEARRDRLDVLLERLTSCIGCGCLSLQSCGLFNRDDHASAHGAGPRYLLGDEPPAGGGSTRAGMSTSIAAMERGWDLDDYRELLGAARTGGYRFSTFDDPPEPGRLFLRHDVDLTLDAALTMARLESELDIVTTYLLMTESLFYNLASPEGREAIEELRELGHRVGLHAVYPNAALDDRFEPVVAWHNPEPAYMSDPIPGVVNVMSEPYFTPPTYRSDSNQHWRMGDPRDELRSGAFPWLQLLIHPAIWAYPGSTMHETMQAMLEAERARRLGQLPGDRIEMR